MNVFSWAALQPSEDTYNFEKLDKIMDLVEANGLKVFLATSTAAHPAWMAKRHPDILRTEFSGMKRKFEAATIPARTVQPIRSILFFWRKSWQSGMENGSA